MQAFSIYDSKAASHIFPFADHTVETAIRTFRELVNGRNEQMTNYPEDFTLMHVGAWDEGLGVWEPMDKKAILTGIDVKVSDDGR